MGNSRPRRARSAYGVGHGRPQVAPRPAAAIVAAIIALGLGGCTGERSTPGEAPVAGASGLPPTPARISAAATADVCIGNGAHDGHAAAGLGCAVCHACAGVLSFGAVTFPGGASTAGGTITVAGGTTTCTVACHSPLGAEPHAVAWNAGPLQCTSCHTNVTTLDASSARSSHVIAGTSTSATCQSCHDQSQHMSGVVRLLNGDGTATSGTCVGCHSGQGQTLGERTPPLLVGWSDTSSGDFHGQRPGTCRFDALDAAGQRSVGEGALPCPAGQPDVPNALRITSRWWYQSGRSGPWVWTCDLETVDATGAAIAPTLTYRPCPEGTVLNTSCNPLNLAQCYPTTLVSRGFGGTLLPPYDRGQGALPCAACHDFHASTNAFLLAAKVNGVTIPPGSIDRAGVGAELLCAACHEGDRHQLCKNCHKEIWTTDGEYSWFEGAPVDPVPAGSACFYCHGHEGIRFMTDASPSWPSDHPFGSPKGDCSHCHGFRPPPPTEYLAPPLSTSPTVSGVTATSATVTWGTGEPATSYVEYGPGTAGSVAGDDVMKREHSVTLTGLTAGTPYVWRVRSSDVFRNVTQSTLQTFTTPSADAVPRPDLAPVAVWAIVGTSTVTLDLVWYGVTAPSGTPVEYEVQLASDPGFTFLVNGSMIGPGAPGATVGDSGWVSGVPTTYGGLPALSHPATLTNIPQDDCGEIIPNVYYWRVRARDQQGRVSEWSATGTLEAFAGDPWC